MLIRSRYSFALSDIPRKKELRNENTRCAGANAGGGWYGGPARVKAPRKALSQPGPGMSVLVGQKLQWAPSSLKPRGGTAVWHIRKERWQLYIETRCEWKRPVIMQTVRHSEQTLKTDLISKNSKLVSQYKLDAGKRQPSSQTMISLDPLTCIRSQIGSSPILKLPRTLNNFSVILTERHPLQRNAVFIYSALDL